MGRDGATVKPGLRNGFSLRRIARVAVPQVRLYREGGTRWCNCLLLLGCLVSVLVSVARGGALGYIWGVHPID